MRGCSSVGQSAGLSRRRSRVRAPSLAPFLPMACAVELNQISQVFRAPGTAATSSLLRSVGVAEAARCRFGRCTIRIVQILRSNPMLTMRFPSAPNCLMLGLGRGMPAPVGGIVWGTVVERVSRPFLPCNSSGAHWPGTAPVVNLHGLADRPAHRQDRVVTEVRFRGRFRITSRHRAGDLSDGHPVRRLPAETQRAVAAGS